MSERPLFSGPIRLTGRGRRASSRARSAAFRFVLFLCFVAAINDAVAALPPEVRKELTELQKELRDVPVMIRKKQVDEAEAVIKKVEDRLTELMIADDERDRSYTSLKSQLEKARFSLPVSFEAEIAPILKTNCIRCHGETQSSANLRLDTFANIARGGRSGPIARPRQPQQSLIMARLLTDMEMQRMPRGAAKLPDPDIAAIARWIEQGGLFDGENQAAPIGESKVVKKPPVKVVMADGTETVSFKNDIAPWVVTICAGCHNDNRKQGGFTVTTFEQLLSGGDTGNTIVPGKPDDSYIVDLVLRQEPLKMPAGQAQLKRSQAQALENWIREGAHFDGTDPKAPLRALVPTDAEMEAAKLAAMSDDEFRNRRVEQATEIWKKVSPRAAGLTVTTDNLVMHGNTTEERLKEIGELGEAHVAALTAKYKLPDGEAPWRGRLIVFVTKDRFDYEEFNTILMNGRRTPKAVSGHSVITPNVETAYVALHDVGEVASADSLASQELLNSLLSQAYLARDGASLPDWLKQGFGILEAGLPATSAYLKSAPSRAATAVATLDSAAKLFDDGTFAPDEVGPVGYLIVKYLLTNGGAARLQQLVSELRTNPDVPRAMRQVYGATPDVLGRAFLSSGGK